MADSLKKNTRAQKLEDIQKQTNNLKKKINPMVQKKKKSGEYTRSHTLKSAKEHRN